MAYIASLPSPAPPPPAAPLPFAFGHISGIGGIGSASIEPGVPFDVATYALVHDIPVAAAQATIDKAVADGIVTIA